MGKGIGIEGVRTWK